MAGNPTAVIIDPSPENRAEAPRLFQEAGAAVVGSGGYGVEASVAVAEADPQLILLSLEEPVARGLQTMSAIAGIAPDKPIIVYSSLSDAPAIRRAMLAGARDYLTTPLTPEAVKASIEAILEQEAVRAGRHSEREPSMTPSGTILTIFGAKGGIGKTTIATNLAVALQHETGQSVALVDMDTRFGDVAVMLDLHTETTVTEAVRDSGTIDRHNIRDYLIRHHSGINVLSAPRSPSDWDTVDPEKLERIIQIIARTFDYVILDTPGTFNEMVGIALESATVVLLVTSMDVTSIKDTLMALNMLRQWGFPQEKIKLVINHANQANSIRDVDVARTLEYEIYWDLPFDLAVSRAGQHGLSVVTSDPRSRAAQDLTALARALGGLSPSAVPRRRGPLSVLSRALHL